MADSKRLRTLKALCEHLRTEVTPANGYAHDLSAAPGSVTRGRMFHDPDDALPAVSILDNPDPDRFPRLAGWQDRLDAPHSVEVWPLLIQGWVKDDKLNPTDPAFNFMADVRKGLAKILQSSHPTTGAQAHPAYMLGDLIEGLTMEPGVCRPPDNISSVAYFWMRLMLRFTEDQNDPYAD